MPLKRTPPNSPAMEHCSSEPTLVTMQTDEGNGGMPVTTQSRYKRKRSQEQLSQDLTDFKTEMRDMLTNWMKHQDSELSKIKYTLNEIKQSNADIEKSMSFISNQYEEMSNRVQTLSTECEKNRDYITFLEEKVEDLQRTTRKTFIEVKNVPKSSNENREGLINMIQNLAKTINIKLDNCDIKDIYRLAGKQQKDNKSIIAELSSTILKFDLLRSSRLYNIRNKNNKLNTSHLGLKDSNTPIFVADYLTPKAGRLYYLARELSRQKNYKFCWTSYGKIYLRKDDVGPIIQIRSENQINSLNKDY